jgi:predicted protein tyrosine phosphatase
MASQANAADLITPNLWLGNIIASQDEDFLKKNGIQAVFNCTKNIPFVNSVPRKYRLAVDDNLQEEEIRNMEHWSIEAVYKLTQEVRNGPVLVHCHAGMQRSASLVAMYLIANYRLKSDDAMEKIKAKRPIAFTPAPNFIRSIKGFEDTFDKMVRPKLD